MTTTNRANNGSKPVMTKPDAMVGAGRLNSKLWKTRDNEVDFDFNVFRDDRMTGQVDQLFQSADVADLARLAQLLAAEMSTDEALGQETCDDLACLAACLEDVLPSGYAYPGIRCREGGSAGRMITKVVDHLWFAEGKDFRANPSSDHVYRQMVAVDAWLRGVGPVSGSELPSIDPTKIEDDEGVCPICGTNDGYYGLSDGPWFVCHVHRVRWIASAALCREFFNENPRDWPENDQEFRRYQDIYPMFNPDTAVKRA